MRKKITKLFEEVGKDYEKRNIASFEIYQGHDVNIFYRLPRNIENLVHIQGYPGLSTEHEARVFARMMDYNKMISIRKTGRVAIGNEHDAVVRSFPNFENSVLIPYERDILEDMLGENVQELSSKNIIPIDKWSLRDYLKTIDLMDAERLRERAPEIMNNIGKIMSFYLKLPEDDETRQYYAPAVILVEDAFRKGDFHEAFPFALDFMIGSIDWE